MQIVVGLNLHGSRNFHIENVNKLFHGVRITVKILITKKTTYRNLSRIWTEAFTICRFPWNLKNVKIDHYNYKNKLLGFKPN